jgi:succinoglycan biosynthesis transport protein ExoP
VITAAQRAGRVNHDLSKSVSVSARPDLLVLQFDGRAATPTVAATYANLYARAFITTVDQQQRAERDRALSEPQKRAAQIRTSLANLAPASAEAQALNAELQTLQASITQESISATDEARVIEPALAPSSAASPRPLRNGLIAAIIAFILGASVVLLRGLLADRFESVEEAAMTLALPVLGELPKARPNQQEALEAFRKLRAQVEFSFGDDATDGAGPQRVLLVTSPESGAGKSYVSANLARALASDGRRVVAVDGDLRRPTLNQTLGLQGEPGLSEILMGPLHPRWAEAITAAELPPAARDRGGALSLLPAGSPAQDTAERLSSESLEQVFSELRHDFDYTVVDSPPVLAIVDAVLLSRRVDAVLLVVDARARRRDVRRAVQTLRAVDAPLIGLVYNRSRSSSANYGYYRKPATPSREAEIWG